jgi:phage terminase small subunit
MGNQKKLTPKQQKFVHEICKGINPSQAYINAYNPKTSNKKVITNQAQKVLKKPCVSLAIEENKKQIQEKIAYTVEESFRKLIEIQQKAFEYKSEVVTRDGDVVVVCNPDLKTALKAEELKGKLLGFYSEKTKVEINSNAPVQIVFNEHCKGL